MAKKTSSIFMALTLLWLTVSLPVVYESQQEAQKTQASAAANDDNPLASTTEEKAPSPTTLSEEYLHHTDEPEHPWTAIQHHHRNFSSSLYIAFHGELISPPPDANIIF
ncbi:MAG: hypothetical protein ABIT05_01855 [Chitinophagaceae bacterium]